MQVNLKPQWHKPYTYMARDFKQFWNRNGSKICTIAGTTGIFLSGVHACRTTYKKHDKLREYGEYIRETKERASGEKWYRRFAMNAKAYAVCGAKTSISYLPDIVGGALSGYCISKGWHIEHANYQQATAMVGVIAGSFMNYRKNVIAEHGAEADRRYMTTRREDRKVLEATMEDGTKVRAKNDKQANGEGLVVSVNPGVLKIFYSKETTPMVWSPSHIIRMQYLEGITSKLATLLKCGGHYTVNDVRREFYGVKGDVRCGAIFGRVWDPGNPEHPERGAAVNLHYQDDEDFMLGLKDSCWIIIDIDDESLLETLGGGNTDDIPGVED